MAKKKAKKKMKAIALELWDVILSYPDLNNPKPFKGKIYYRTDVLFDKKHPDAKKVDAAIKEIGEELWGDDRSEWPENTPFLKNGDDREDSKGYAGRRYITASTQSPVQVLDDECNRFSPANVKGGMFANVAVTIKAWEFDGDEGISIYLDGVQIDTQKEALNFGGGKPVAERFKKKSSRDEDEDEEEDEAPRKKKPSRDEDDEEDEAPKKKKKPSRDDDDEEEDEKPRKRKKPVRDEDEDEEDDSDSDDEDEDY